jgi:excisionase family DNA binding protein
MSRTEQEDTPPVSQNAVILFEHARVAEAADMLGMSPSSIYRYVKAGQLPAVRQRRRIYIAWQEVRKLHARRNRAQSVHDIAGAPPDVVAPDEKPLAVPPTVPEREVQPPTTRHGTGQRDLFWTWREHVPVQMIIWAPPFSF